eukprot:6184758-Pleurochrysis_carterae.AAC.3
MISVRMYLRPIESVCRRLLVASRQTLLVVSRLQLECSKPTSVAASSFYCDWNMELRGQIAILCVCSAGSQALSLAPTVGVDNVSRGGAATRFRHPCICMHLLTESLGVECDHERAAVAVARGCSGSSGGSVDGGGCIGYSASEG